MEIKLGKAYDGQYSRYSYLIAVAFLFLAALGLRLPALTLNSFWHDELFTASFVLAPIRVKLDMLIADFHPPLFNVVVYFWSLLWGTSELALRMFSVLLGTIAVPISFLLFRKCFNRFIAFAIATLTLFLPSHIYYSQEFRSYSLGFFVAVIATGYLFFYLENSNRKNCWALAVSCALLFAIHYVSIFYIITIYLLAVIRFDHGLRVKWTRALDLGLLTFALMLPNMLHFIYKRLTTTFYWPKPVTLDKVIDTILFMVKGDKILFTILLLSIIVALWYAFYYKYKTLSFKIRVLALLSVLPLSGAIFISLLTPNVTILIDRIILIFSPAIIALTAVGMSFLPNKTLRICILLLYSVLSAWWLFNSSYYTIPTKSDFREVAKEIAKIEGEHGKILLISLDNSKMRRHKYYFDMFAVKSEIFNITKEMSDNAVLERIRNAVMIYKPSKIVLFSSHILLHEDVIRICDNHFAKEYERNFIGFMPKHTVLMVYSVPKMNRSSET